MKTNSIGYLFSKGGQGSGFFGHAGRPGKIGGSSSGENPAPASASSFLPNWFTQPDIDLERDPKTNKPLSSLRWLTESNVSKPKPGWSIDRFLTPRVDWFKNR